MADELKPMDHSVLEHGRVYRILGRNLDLGVYNKESKGFIGIREKFGDRFLDTEYEGMGIRRGSQPEPTDFTTTLPIKTSLGTFDENTGLAVLFDRPKSQGGKGWYFVDDRWKQCPACEGREVKLTRYRMKRRRKLGWPYFFGCLRCRDFQEGLVPLTQEDIDNIRPLSEGNKPLFDFLKQVYTDLKVAF